MGFENAAATPLSSHPGYATNADMTLPTPACTAAPNGTPSVSRNSSSLVCTTGSPSCESLVARPCPG